ncbi:MAG: NfeD family protein [Euryarchaeota archaeon]|nr:NfeD family protein [Euryarchaeota archaeon]MDE1835178.1 NfeD family protein [Euryarchaeota archaeon]MDE1880411.1 NfeD family protein [Euryarchaeota archaeon]MDE2045720.1 NfeD family protein [Thermoplasmata archaeon]
MVTDVVILGIGLILIGVLLLIMEFIHPGTFVVIPGTIIVVAGVLLLAFGSLDILTTVGGPFIVAGVLIGAGILAILFYSRLAPTHPPVASTFDTLQNYPGEVTVAVEPGTMKGKIRVRGEIWSARSDVAIPVGAEVKILGGQGVILRVAPASDGASPPVKDAPDPSSST